MRRSDPLELVDAGSLQRPGPVGRSVRLVLGIACLYALFQLALYRQSIVATPLSVLPNFGLMVVPAVFVINYVVNIGFGKSWGRGPTYLSLVGAVFLAAIAWAITGSADHAILGAALWLWLVYFYGHLGISFVLSAAIATPGCEMRAIPELLGKLAGRSAQEHHCPAAFITKVDKWEHGRQAPGH